MCVLWNGTVFAQQLQLGQTIFSGNGCRQDGSRATLSPDGRQISILFDNYSVQAGGFGGSTVDSKNCDISVVAKVPHGFSVALFSIDYRGFAAVPYGGRLRFSADYNFAGKNSRRYSQEFVGPMNDNFNFRNEINSQINIWSACGAEVILKTQSNLVAEASQSETVTGSLDSIDIQSGITYNFQYRECSEPGAQPIVEPIQSPTLPPQNKDLSIHGWVDGLQDLGEQGYLLNGWACSKNINSSIDVHVYINGPAGQGQFVKAGTGNLGSEEAVSRECQTSGVKHRFSIPFSKDEASRFANSSIWVHGISPVNLPNLHIGNSGGVIFPKIQSKLLGGLAEVYGDGSGGNQVVGWACMIDQIRPIDVEVFIGGPVGIGIFGGSQTTNSGMDFHYTRNACGFNNQLIGFVVVVPEQIVKTNLNKPIYVYGIDPTTGQFHQLDGSGQRGIVFSLRSGSR